MAKSDLHVRPPRREDLAGWYADVLADQEASGLSVAEYAADLGLTATTLYQWKRRLSVSAQRSGASRSQATGLIQVSLRRESFPDEGPAFVVRLTGERCVEVPADFDGDALHRLLGVLETC